MTRTRGWHWPWIIGALLVGTAAVQGVLIWAATHDPTFAVVPDYYRSAVAWDSTMARERANLALGWSARATIVRERTGADVIVRLSDSAQRPVRGARVRVTAIHNLAGGSPVEGAMAERADGAYDARLPLERPGLWELRVEAVRGADRFTASLRADTSPR